jgi:hypothetical protein
MTWGGEVQTARPGAGVNAGLPAFLSHSTIGSRLGAGSVSAATGAVQYNHSKRARATRQSQQMGYYRYVYRTRLPARLPDAVKKVKPTERRS